MVDRFAIKEWSKLKYQDPKIVLLKLKELEIIASNYQIDMKVRNFRTNSLKCYREGREAAIFCYGMGKTVVHTPVYFAIVENADYDCVTRCKYGFTPVQIKELVPEYLNPTKDLNQIIAELKKYPVSHNTVIAIHVNRQVRLEFDKIEIPDLNVAEVWLFGGTSPDRLQWFLYRDLRSDPQLYKFEYPN